MSLWAVMTTIQPPTECVRGLVRRLPQGGAELLVVGDRKGPAAYPLPGVHFLSLETQQGLGLQLAPRLPTGHYARKNLGYLVAMQRGASCIYETDDDNVPNAAWAPRKERVAALAAPCRDWVNVYRYFTTARIWPRGYPLDRINEPATLYARRGLAVRRVAAPVQQGLIDRAPDVDAVWRLVGDREACFRRGRSVWVPPGAACPFNTQSTWWWPAAYPLMYLPSYSTFRMTDIWRSFVAQRCLWELGLGVVFHAAEAEQDRNPHDLMRDFRDEVPGYLGNDAIVRTLRGLSLAAGAGALGANLRTCYEALVRGQYLPPEELPLVDAWLADLRTVLAAGSAR